MRNAFAAEITELALADDRIVLLSGDIGNRLGNIPRVQANFWGHVNVRPDVVASLGANVVGRRFGTIANTYELPKYGTVDASIAWQVTPRLKAECFVQNLFDQEYVVGLLPTTIGSPRLVNGGLRVKFSGR